MMPSNFAKYAKLADEVRETVEAFTVPVALLWLADDKQNVRQTENGSGVLTIKLSRLLPVVPWHIVAKVGLAAARPA